MKQVNVHYAKTHLSQLLREVEQGEEIVIARAGKPAVKLSAVEPPRPKPRELGVLKGKLWISPDFDDPLPDEILATFEGRDE